MVRLLVAPLHLPFAGWAASMLTDVAGTPVRVERVGVRLKLSGLALTLSDVRLRTTAYSASIGEISVLNGLFFRSIHLDNAALRFDPSLGETKPIVLPHPDDAIAGLQHPFYGRIARIGSHARVR